MNSTQQLNRACSSGDVASVQRLLDEGANPNAIDKGGKSPLSIASAKGDVIIVNLLISKGAKVDSTDTKEMVTPLLLASAYGHIDVVKQLLDNGANINYISKSGATAAMLAAENRHADVLEFLKQKGADLKLKDIDGRTAIDYAKLSGYANAKLVLCKCGRRIKKNNSWCMYCGAKNWRGILGDVLFATILTGVGIAIMAIGNNPSSIISLIGFGILIISVFGWGHVLMTLTSSKTERLEKTKKERLKKSTEGQSKSVL